ncbi:MAG: LysR family transcriptional regulator [Bacteroidota bacterium]
MNLRYLKLVKTIVEEGNISKSADRLFLTQSALSHQLRDFEERLGIKIFIRTRNNWKLTPEGEEVYQVACEVISRIDEGLQKISKVQEGSRGTIKLSTECYSFYHGLPKFIQKMSALYPEIEIILTLESQQHFVSQLISGELDICLNTHNINNSDIVSYKLFSDEMFALVHEENKLAQLKFISPNGFSNINLIIHSFPLESAAIYKHFLKPNNIEPQKVTAIPMTEVAIELVEANMGIACYPKWQLRSFQLPNSLKLVKIGKEGFIRTHYLSTRSNFKKSKYIQDFIDSFLEENITWA